MEEILAEKKPCECLYIEKEEDHVHRQKDRKVQGCFTGKLAYFLWRKKICAKVKEV